MKYEIKPRELAKARIKTLSHKDRVYLIETKKEIVIVQRQGECNYKKCKSACCRLGVYHYDSTTANSDYWRNLGKVLPYDKSSIVLDVKCNKLNKDHTCKSFKKSNWPKACQQFPHITDSTYWMVHEKCTFYFEILEDFDLIN